jgi:hypothetical protein
MSLLITIFVSVSSDINSFVLPSFPIILPICLSNSLSCFVNSRISIFSNLETGFLISCNATGKLKPILIASIMSFVSNSLIELECFILTVLTSSSIDISAPVSYSSLSFILFFNKLKRSSGTFTYIIHVIN